MIYYADQKKNVLQKQKVKKSKGLDTVFKVQSHASLLLGAFRMHVTRGLQTLCWRHGSVGLRGHDAFGILSTSHDKKF